MKPGRPQKIDVSLMVVLARLLEVVYGMKPKPAARAAIQCWLTTLSDDEQTSPAEYRVASLERGVLKALQRFKAGKADVHPDITRAMGFAWPSTGERALGRLEDIAAKVAAIAAKSKP